MALVSSACLRRVLIIYKTVRESLRRIVRIPSMRVLMTSIDALVVKNVVSDLPVVLQCIFMLLHATNETEVTSILFSESNSENSR